MPDVSKPFPALRDPVGTSFYRGPMSIVVDLADLPDVLATFGTGYLLSTDGTGVKAVHVAPDEEAGEEAGGEAGGLRLRTPGRGSLANVAANPRVTLVWPPRAAPGFSLIVDAEARPAADRAVALGAGVVHRSPHGYVVLRSPGGLLFCCVGHAACLRAPAATWPDGSRSAVDQVCVDAPAHLVDAERDFWTELTGWVPQPSSVSGAFSSLRRPEGRPLRLLFQRVDDDRPAVTAHLDVACGDRAAETARHRALGAEQVAEHERWTVLRDPSGATYCLTDRDPVTGVP